MMVFTISQYELAIGIHFSFPSSPHHIPARFNFYNRYMPIQMVCFLYEFCQAVYLNELVCFILVIRFVGVELFIVFLYYPFNVHGICSDVPSFISDISNLCLLSLFLLVRLARGLSILLIFSQN